MKRSTREAWQGILYILPGFLLIFTFSIVPIFMTGYFSLTDYNLMRPAQLIGLKNYSRLFHDSYFSAALQNTLLYTLVTVPLQTAGALTVAAFFAQKLQSAAGGFLRSILFIPVIASSVTAATIWKIIFATDSGVCNTILGVFGIGKVNWLGNPSTALLSICIVAIWKNVGYFMVIYYAGMMAISRDLYEAARIDGATQAQVFFRVTLPLLKPITYLVVTLGIIWSFQVFDLSYQMTGGGPGTSTVTLVMQIYNSAFKQYRVGYACALAMLLLALVLVINLVESLFFREREGKRDV